MASGEIKITDSQIKPIPMSEGSSGEIAIDEKTKAIRNKAGEFTLNLVKALVTTGIYQSDHPMAKTFAKDIYRQFKELTSEGFEVTYLYLANIGEQGTILLEGILPEPIEVVKAFRGVMGDHFLAKLIDYFMRNRIASFTIKRGIDEEEFDKFMSLWVTWALRGFDPNTATTAMSDELTKEGILNVTVVGLDELVGAQRRLPWAVKIALGRLRKDLSRIPMLKKAKPEVIAKLKIQVIADVVRPLSRPELTRDLLLNADLVAEGMPFIGEIEIEDAIVEAMSGKLLFGTAPLLLSVNEKLRSVESQTKVAGRTAGELIDVTERVSKKVIHRLARVDIKEAWNFLEDCYHKGIISLELLPDELRRHIKAVQMTEQFLASSEQYLADFEKCTDAQKYLKYLNVFSIVLPMLASRRDFKHVNQICGILAKHHALEKPPFPGMKRFIEDALKGMSKGTFIRDLIALAISTGKEDRAGIEAGVALFGEDVIPSLVNVLATSEDISQRTVARSILLKIGNIASEYIVDELRAHHHTWIAARNLISMLAELGNPAAIPAVLQYSSHPHSKIREECIITLAKIAGEKAIKPLLDFLRDKDPNVVKRAIQQLALLKATNPSFLTAIYEFIHIRTKQEEEPDETIQAACLRALSEFERVLLPEKPDLEGTLIQIIRPTGLRSYLPGKFGIRKKSPDLIILAIEALGSIGGGRAVPFLSAYLESNNDRARQAAAEALERIRNRQTVQLPAQKFRF